MDKVLSARLHPAAIEKLNRAAKRLGMTKKEFLESAIDLRAQQLDEDIWEQTSGAWTRDEPAEQTHRRSRAAFRDGFRRHHRRHR